MNGKSLKLVTHSLPAWCVTLALCSEQSAKTENSGSSGLLVAHTRGELPETCPVSCLQFWPATKEPRLPNTRSSHCFRIGESKMGLPCPMQCLRVGSFRASRFLHKNPGYVTEFWKLWEPGFGFWLSSKNLEAPRTMASMFECEA